MLIGFNVGSFLAMAAIASILLNLLLQSASDTSDSFAYLLRHKDDFDVVFMGSSLVENMIDPREFDAAVARGGYVVSSFNCGRGGGFAHETDYYVRRLIRARPGRLHFLVIDALPFSAADTEFDKYNDILWHDFVETKSVIHSAWIDGSLGRDERIALTIRHLGAAASNAIPTSGFYRFMELRKRTLLPRAGYGGDFEGFFADYRGYGPFSSYEGLQKNLLRARHKNYLAGLDGYNVSLQYTKRKFAEGQGGSLEDFNVRALRAQQETIRAAGVESIYLAAPSFMHKPFLLRRLLREGIIKNAFCFDDPSEYPQFFESGARFDIMHLTDDASKEYSRLLGERFVALVESDAGLRSKLRKKPFPGPSN